MTCSRFFRLSALAIKDQIMDNWIDTQKAYEKQDPKMVYYMVHGISDGSVPLAIISLTCRHRRQSERHLTSWDWI